MMFSGSGTISLPSARRLGRILAVRSHRWLVRSSPFQLHQRQSFFSSSATGKAAAPKQGGGGGGGAAAAAAASESSTTAAAAAETAAQPLSLLAAVLAWYARKLETHPILTKSITSGLIAGAGDLLCQAVVDKPEKERQLLLLEHGAGSSGDGSSSKDDANGDGDDGALLARQPPLWWWEHYRTLNFTVLGGLMVGPALHYWYGGLAARFPLGAAAAPAVLKRVACDQFVFTPLFVPLWMAALWTLDGIAEGTPLEETRAALPRRMVDTLPDVIVANWMLWWPVQCINFFVTPVQFQVLASNCVALLWNAYLSFSTRAAVEESHGAVPLEEIKEQKLQRRLSAR